MRSKRRLLSALAVGATLLVIGATRVQAASAKYVIDQTGSNPTAQACCGSAQVTGSAVQQPGEIRDADSGSGRALLTQTVVAVADVVFTTPSVCGSTSSCAVTGSSFTATFGNVCVFAVVQGTMCKVYSLNPIPITISQQISCNGGGTHSRTLTVQGEFRYDGCTNTGYIKFSLPSVPGVRPCVNNYIIPLRGRLLGAYDGSDACAKMERGGKR